MGMDCTGLKPANETGEYFHNTVWAWPPTLGLRNSGMLRHTE